jgi:hypothetical protein
MSEPVQIQAERGEDYDILLPDGKSLFVSVLREAVVVLAYNADGSRRGESLHLRLDDFDEDCWDAARASVPVGGDPDEALAPEPDEEDTSESRDFFGVLDSVAPLFPGDDMDEVDIEDEVDGMVDPTDRWTCWDIAGVRVSYDRDTAEEAAYAYVFDGDYGHPTLGEWTSFIEVQVAETADGPDARGVTIHVPLYPGSPPCSDDINVVDPNDADDDGHLWHRVSTYGDGAGVYVTEVCGWCGILKDTRTRPQCSDCGETMNTEAIRYRREEE